MPKKGEDAEAIRKGQKTANDLSEDQKDYYLEKKVSSFWKSSPKRCRSRAAKERCNGSGFGVNETGEAVFLDFASAIERYGKEQANIKGLDENDDKLVNTLGRDVIKW